MRKLRLAVDELEVQSFTTDELSRGRGTVHGHTISYQCNTNGPACTQQETCAGGNTCVGPSCPALSCDDCGSDQCGTDGSCWNQSCVDTCLVTCRPC